MKMVSWILIAAAPLYADIFLLGGALLTIFAALISLADFIWLAIKQKSIREAVASERMLPPMLALPFVCLIFGALLNRQIENKVIGVGNVLEEVYRVDGK